MPEPLPIPALSPEESARFWSHVDQSGGPDACHPWTGAHTGGYGEVGVKGRKLLAHRVASTLAVGPIPDGLELDHVRERGCVRPDCCNERHLEPVTRAENTRRQMRSGRRWASRLMTEVQIMAASRKRTYEDGIEDGLGTARSTRQVAAAAGISVERVRALARHRGLGRNVEGVMLFTPAEVDQIVNRDDLRRTAVRGPSETS